MALFEDDGMDDIKLDRAMVRHFVSVQIVVSLYILLLLIISGWFESLL